METDTGADADFVGLFRAEYPPLVHSMYLIVHDWEQARDIAQEAFVQLFTRWRRISKYERPDAWVRRVAIRMAVRAIRRERLRRRSEHEFDRARPLGPVDIDVLRAVAKLPAAQRAAVVLFYLEDRPVAEVAEILACSEVTARVHLHRARKRLAEILGGLKSRQRVTPTDLRQAAKSLSHETKFRDLRTDAGAEVPALETLFVDLVKFCLDEKRKTAFLVSKDDVDRYPDVHDLIQQLMDFKLIHLVDESTSAASGRPGRFEAYTLDFALFMEPRRRNIEIVRFWETDDQRRRVRLREAPDYPLLRGDALVKGDRSARAEEALRVADQVPADTDAAEPLRLFW